MERVDRERQRGNRSSASLYWRATSREVSRTLIVEEHAPLLYVEESLRLGLALVANTDPYTHLIVRIKRSTQRPEQVLLPV